jgi:hypothetical protein
MAKSLKFVNDLISRGEFTTKITIYFGTPDYDENYDKWEKNLVYTNLNPQTIKGYVREIGAESLVWRQMGLQEMGAKEIICKEKYREWFTNATKIEIDGDNYTVMKEGTGGNFLVSKRPYGLLRVILSKST